jgi:hypothetical protein
MSPQKALNNSQQYNHLIQGAMRLNVQMSNGGNHGSNFIVGKGVVPINMVEAAIRQQISNAESTS